MNSVSNIINPFLIKESFNKYNDSNSFLNYQKIAKDYYKLYTKYEKKLNSIQPENLRTKIKTWFFNLSLESRIKICTVENALFSTIIYQMYLKTKMINQSNFFLSLIYMKFMIIIRIKIFIKNLSRIYPNSISV